VDLTGEHRLFINRRQAMNNSFDRRQFLKLAGTSALGLSLFACSRSPSPGAGGSVIVGGAGLSGLTAALLLEERGVEVKVLEARERLGGRVFTLENVPGIPEGGGPVIASSYKRLLRLAELASVPMQPAPGFDPKLLLHINGKTLDVQAWAGSEANLTVGAERNLPPSLLTGYYVKQDVPLKDETSWLSPSSAALDIPLYELLRQRGASEEALRLMNIAPNTNDISTTSALWSLRDAQRRSNLRGVSILGASGGNSRIIEGMARAIKGDIQTGMAISHVRSTEQGVEVTCADGSVHTADYCVMTLPFSVMKDVTFDPPLEGTQREAVEKIPYTATTKYYLAPKSDFWEEDGLPLSLWSDSIIERVFPTRDAAGKLQSFTVWIDGTNAQKLDSMPLNEQHEVVLSEFARIRPASEGQVELVETISWGKDPYARGAYAHYAPGQVSRLRPTMAYPWQRTHFAGEHTAIVSPGMEGAVESAERAVDEILKRYKQG
jgi:monoamine oxidase